ncbi:MAG: zinc ribbon domain-containing protein [Bacteroidaceae bacterium]|nr:zinc ribbon domain-containing protein [Bacteroidaceae bacterium]
MSMIKCPHCGHNISSMVKYCPECGTKMETPAADGLEEMIEEPTPETEDEELDEKALATAEADAEETLDEEEPEDEEVLTRRFSVRRIVLGIIAAAAIALGLWYFFPEFLVDEKEELAYRSLRHCSDPSLFEGFLDMYPDSKYADEVRELWRQASAMKGEWDVLIATGSAAQLEEYIARHPESPYIHLAEHRLDSLDWAAVLRDSSEATCERYIMQHPDGYFIGDAQQMMSRLEAARRARTLVIQDTLQLEAASADSASAAPVADGTTEGKAAE